ncbi:MAG: peptide chain release factor 1 [Alphaproteobacteria bacterium]|jgi:peptide chain release factor 1|nr:peptide chain release factor 1 [Alphaproteobacteria bacterium]
MSFEDNLKSLVNKHKELGDKLAEGVSNPAEYSSNSKEYNNLSPIVQLITSLWDKRAELKDLNEIIDSPTSEPDIKHMAKDEYPQVKESIETLENDLKIALLPKDKDDEKSVIIELRAGTGGDEAAIFAADLFRMYSRYAENRKWKVEVMSMSENGVGGYKEIIASINGNNVFSRLKFESGVHRVQRVPETEANGRVHTSAATVAVLPEAEEVDIQIDEKDLRIDIYRSSGAGGQHVNTTDSAVRITHIPTGIVVAQQDERSQHKNKAKAMKILMSRIYEQQRTELDMKRSADRKSQVGSGDRSERIRTYNFPQGRVSDHRINLTLYKLDRFMEGELDEMIDALTAADQALKLANAEGLMD